MGAMLFVGRDLRVSLLILKRGNEFENSSLLVNTCRANAVFTGNCDKDTFYLPRSHRAVLLRALQAGQLPARQQAAYFSAGGARE